MMPGNTQGLLAIFRNQSDLEDEKLSTWLGKAILNNKPVMIIADHQVKLPPMLVRVSKVIERVDATDQKKIDRAVDTMAELARELR